MPTRGISGKKEQTVEQLIPASHAWLKLQLAKSWSQLGMAVC
jgi:hypothetical protein